MKIFNNKIKIEIKSIFGKILFTYEKESNTIKDTVLEAIKQNADLSSADLSSANLSFADLRFTNLRFTNLSSANLRFTNLSSADLSSANLSSANLSSANLRFTNLRSANLSSANLSFADLRFTNLRFTNLRFAKNWQNTEWANQAKQNILYILSYFPTEVQGLKDKIIAGKINGTQYSGECCCLIGTLGDEKACNVIPYYTKGLHNLGEQLFFQIRQGDTPENNEFSKLAVEICNEALLKNN
jgi:hypothetical protein